MAPLRAITFDVTGTLIHTPRVFEIYSQVLSRHGFDAPVEHVAELFPLVMDEMSCRVTPGVDRFRAHPDGPRGWWQDVLDRLCQYLEQPTPTPFAAAELYHRFSQADAWEVYPDTRPVLEALRRRGLALAVVSNWDDRLGRLLTHLDLVRHFDAVVFSYALGIEKPDGRLFAHALDLLGVRPEEALHVGDRLREDVEGALGAGLAARRVERSPGASPRRAGVPELVPCLRSLHDLPRHLDDLADTAKAVC
jgi:putative hydrolase of the HAD superfamily